jgi:hypothetical protein
MKTRDIFTVTTLLAMLAGCQSAPWTTALGSKFRNDKSSRAGDQDDSDEMRLISDSNRNRFGGFRLRGSDGDEVRQDGGDLGDVLRRGHHAEEDGDIRQAKVFYRKALDIDPENPLAHHRLAIIADSERDFRTAEEHYLAALSVKGNDPNLLSDLGYSFLLQNRSDESKYYLQQALKEDPSHERALNNLGLLHARQGDYDGALALFQQTGSEREVKSKMAELFPAGRPRGNGENPFRNSSLAGNGQRPFRSQVTQASVPPLWENSGTGNRVQTGDSFSGRSNTYDSRNQFQPIPDARQSSGERDAYPSERNNDFGRGYNENASRLANRENEFTAGSNRPNPFSSEATRTTGQRVDSRQLPSNPLNSLEEWPPLNQSKSAPPRGEVVPFPPDTDSPENSFGPSSQNLTDPFARRQRTVQSASDQTFAPRAAYDANVRSRSAATTIDRRQQAALMGLNAGPGGVFPVTHEGNSAVRQPRYPPVRRSQNVVPDFDSQPMSNFNAADLRREFSAAPTSQAEQGAVGRPDQSLLPTNFGNDRYRTAARPVSQPPENYYPRNGNGAVQPDVGASGQRSTIHQFRQLMQQSNEQPNSRPAENSVYPPSSRTQYPQNNVRQPELPPERYDSRQTPRQPYPSTGSDGSRFAPQSFDRNQTQSDPQFNPGNSFQQGSSSR